MNTAEAIKMTEREKKLFSELDKGIDDMEQGKVLPHDEAMKMIRERLKKYEI